MLEYFKIFYLEMAYGPSYIPTELFFVAGLVLVFDQWKCRRKEAGGILSRILLTWLLLITLSGIYYALFGAANLNKVVTAIVVILYVIGRQKYTWTIRIVRGSVYYTCYFQILTLSEPLGTMLESVFGEEKVWLENATWITLLVLLTVLIYLIHIWSVDDMLYVPTAPAILIIIEALLGITLQYAAEWMEAPKAYKVVVAGAFWLLEIFSYYLFYIVSRESKRNVEILALEHKEQMNEEMLQTFRDNLESMHVVRHEIKNHMAYIRVLVANEDYDKLFDYTNAVLGETEELFSTVNSGNDVVDAVINHAIQKGKKQGIAFETQIIVPNKLPYEEIDFCSILSNLTENALEASMICKKKNPVIEVSIQPRQDYLFLRITNPVSNLLTRKQMLSLKTIKTDTALHGYGTKVVKNLVEKYQGSIKYDIKDGRFIADVMLDLNGEGQGEL